MQGDAAELAGMAGPAQLSPTELDLALRALPSWALADGQLHRSYRFKDFRGAFTFMTSVAMFAERRQHHPEWRNVWNTVEVWLTTHDAGGVTALDVELAHAMDASAG